MSTPTRAQYDAALEDRASYPDEYTKTEPSQAVLDNVAVIRAYEADPANQPPEDNGAQQ